VHNVVLYYWIWTGITCTSIVKDFFVVWTIFEDCYYFESSDLINATLVLQNNFIKIIVLQS
ncbi:MAG: hypothetical protein ACH0QD_06030, partial [Tepidibacillus sp.]